MTCRVVALCLDAHDPQRLAAFWAGVLGGDVVDDPAGAAVRPPDGGDFRLRFPRSDAPRHGLNRGHPDFTSTSPEDQRRTVARALALGARPLDVGQLPGERHVVLQDPEGNPLDVIEPGNAFLADCGFVGALACDGTRQVGHFWRDVLGWPLVWDQDEETAIRSPHGGPKITWGGPPLPPKVAKNRLHVDLAADGDRTTEIARLLALGATHVDIGQGDVAWTVLADPDGNEFCVVAESWVSPP